MVFDLIYLFLSVSLNFCKFFLNLLRDDEFDKELTPSFEPELSDLLLHGYNDVNTEFFQPVQTNSVSPDKIFQSVSVQVLDYKGSRVIDQEQTNEAVRFNNKN